MSMPVLKGFFSLSGRRNRLSYFLYSIVWLCAAVALVMLMIIPATLAERNGSGGAGMNGLIIPLLILMVPLWLSPILVGAQRCRDFGWTGWAILLCAIPYLGTIFALAILFIPGTDGANRYGPDPLKTA